MKFRQFLYIAAVFGIFALSVYFTCMVSAVFRSSFENGETIMDMDVSTYQVKYDNVWDKMKIYAKCEKETKFAQINAEMSDENKQEFIKRVGIQIGTINKYFKNIVPDIFEEKIKSCTQYVSYGDSESNGFACWYLVYDGGEGEVRMIVDTEFMTIYKISVTETITGNSTVVYAQDGKQDGKIHMIDDRGKIAVEYSDDWSDYEIHSNLFLEFYKMTMNKMPDFHVVTSARGIEIYAAYHDDLEGADVEVPFLIRNNTLKDKQVFEWGMTCFDELIQQ
ncbi:MAG: hypothetical protein HFH14_10320 [Lachnospiraceae bacterium]|nr:hypothetical protein [Lachnospiraceae bacterium]